MKLLYILAAVIAFTRLYLYVHFPSDVLAGLLLGIVSGWVAYHITTAIQRKRRFF